jgi:hypothetical protein
LKNEKTTTSVENKVRDKNGALNLSMEGQPFSKREGLKTILVIRLHHNPQLSKNAPGCVKAIVLGENYTLVLSIPS